MGSTNSPSLLLVMLVRDWESNCQWGSPLQRCSASTALLGYASVCLSLSVTQKQDTTHDVIWSHNKHRLRTLVVVKVYGRNTCGWWPIHSNQKKHCNRRACNSLWALLFQCLTSLVISWEVFAFLTRTFQCQNQHLLLQIHSQETLKWQVLKTAKITKPEQLLHHTAEQTGTMCKPASTKMRW